MTSRWVDGRVRITGYFDGDDLTQKEVDCYRLKPDCGLVVTRKRAGGDAVGKGWVITHCASGAKIGGLDDDGFKLATAMKIVEAIAGVTDWKRSRDQLIAQADDLRPFIQAEISKALEHQWAIP